MDMSHDERFITLETKLAYQEDTLVQLNDVITRQQDEIDLLEAALRALIDRVNSLGEPGAAKHTLAEEVPPHY
jgi:SlyX protein